MCLLIWAGKDSFRKKQANPLCLSIPLSQLHFYALFAQSVRPPVCSVASCYVGLSEATPHGSIHFVLEIHAESWVI
jgi:hypothetical protein